MKCIRCGRTISNEKSVIEGYGPICYKKKDIPFTTKTFRKKSYIKKAKEDKTQQKITSFIEQTEEIESNYSND